MIKGEKVTLRAVERADLPRMLEFNNNMEVELAGGGDPPMPQSMARIEADYERQVSGGGRDENGFAIEADGQIIGFCGIFNFDHVGRTCELGITIGDKAYWGRGYGREAIALLVDYAFTYRNFRKVWLRVHGVNERAIKAYTACGFVEEGRQKSHVYSAGKYIDLVYMGNLRE